MKVFAPGKLVLTGAYVVLGGAPAIVVATSRGAYADGSRTNPTPTAEVRAALGDVVSPHVDASSLFLGSRKLGLGASSAILVASLGAREAARGADLGHPDVRLAIFNRARAAHALQRHLPLRPTDAARRSAAVEVVGLQMRARARQRHTLCDIDHVAEFILETRDSLTGRATRR